MPGTRMRGSAALPEGAELVRDLERFVALREPWEALRARVPGFTFYQSHSWLCTWWEHFGSSRRLFVCCIWQGDELVGAAPLCLARLPLCPVPIRVLQFIGCEQGDFARMLLPPDEAEAATTIWQTIASRRGEWSVADLRYLPEDGLGPCTALEAAHARREQQEREVNRWIDFDGAGWRERVKKPMRHNVERQRRRLEAEAPLSFERAADAATARAFFAELAELHAAQWAERGETSVFALPGHREWAERATLRAFDEGSLHLCRVRHGERTMVVGLSFVERGHLLVYQYAYDGSYAPYSPAGVLMAAILDDLQERGGATRLDFGRGNEEYKARWTDNERMLYRQLLFPEGLAGHFHEALMGKVMPYIWQRPRLARLVREAKRRASCAKAGVMGRLRRVKG